MFSVDLDQWIEKVKSGELLPEPCLIKLCQMVMNILIEESNVQPVSSPVTICGDLHGQFEDLLNIFKTAGDVSQTNYVFLGNYVDRGWNSVSTITYLLLLKARWPSRILLLRGNHESAQITQVYGFYDECHRKYGNDTPWKNMCDVFECFSIGALIDNRIFCVHGGLSPDVSSLNQISMLERRQEIPQEGPLCDLMWSDPEENMKKDWCASPRGAGWLFGSKPTTEFVRTNKLDLICRGHQLAFEGYKYHFPEKNLVTVYSAPNHCFRAGNLLGILVLDENLHREFKAIKGFSDESS